MRAAKVWTVLAGAALALGAGACASGTTTAAHSGPTATSTSTAAPPAVSSPAALTPPASPPDVPAAQAPGATPTTRLTPANAAQMILGINAKIQQAEQTPNGPQALTRAQVQAIVEAQTKQLGLPVPKP
ncbi:MAG: hypothetical protein M3N98_00420 [Actinomycetota bacterium]|nr:hypothetical protein [Actinomycetota bacterium]